jgi:hypothetical protein
VNMSNRDLAKAMVALTHAQKRIGPVLSRLRKLANERLASKEVVAAIAADGTVLGNITRTNPAREPFVEDWAVLMAHLQETKPEALYDADVVRTGVTDEQVLAALKAAGLTDTEVRVRDYEMHYLMSKSVQDKKPAAPGIGFVKPPGTTNVYPAKDETEALDAVLTSGEVSLLTGEVAKQIEGGQ